MALSAPLSVYSECRPRLRINSSQCNSPCGSTPSDDLQARPNTAEDNQNDDMSELLRTTIQEMHRRLVEHLKLKRFADIATVAMQP